MILYWGPYLKGLDEKKKGLDDGCQHDSVSTGICHQVLSPESTW